MPLIDNVIPGLRSRDLDHVVAFPTTPVEIIATARYHFLNSKGNRGEFQEVLTALQNSGENEARVANAMKLYVDRRKAGDTHKVAWSAAAGGDALVVHEETGTDSTHTTVTVTTADSTAIDLTAAIGVTAATTTEAERLQAMVAEAVQTELAKVDLAGLVKSAVAEVVRAEVARATVVVRAEVARVAGRVRALTRLFNQAGLSKAARTSSNG
jgi:hypothetical protein